MQAVLIRRRGFFEVGLIAVLYLVSELSRGIAAGGADAAQRHAARVVDIERRLHVFGEAAAQRAAHDVLGLPALLGYAYVSLHLLITGGALVWVYRWHRPAFAAFRNTLFVANGIAVVGYWLFPTAPPRLAGVGIADTVSGATSINLSSNAVSALYNPYAAVPSMHIGFSLIVAVTVLRLAQSRVLRAAAVVYPVFVLFMIVATGNHFFLDAAAGALVALSAIAAVTWRPGRRAAMMSASATGRVELAASRDRHPARGGEDPCAHRSRLRSQRSRWSQPQRPPEQSSPSSPPPPPARHRHERPPPASGSCTARLSARPATST